MCISEWRADNMDILLIITTALTVLAGCQAAACMFGPGCAYPCRCAGQAGCDPSTGACPGGDCTFGWTGAYCNEGQNIALGMNTSSSARPFAPGPDKAVDNNRQTRQVAQCIAITSAPAWWRVGFHGPHRVARVVLFLPEAERNKPLTIYVTNATTSLGFGGLETCQDYARLRPDSHGVVAFGCGPRAVGDSLILHRAQPPLLLCEVEVRGVVIVAEDTTAEDNVTKLPWNDTSSPPTASPCLETEGNSYLLWVFVPVIVVMAAALLWLTIYIIYTRKRPMSNMDKAVRSRKAKRSTHEYQEPCVKYKASQDKVAAEPTTQIKPRKGALPKGAPNDSTLPREEPNINDSTLPQEKPKVKYSMLPKVKPKPIKPKPLKEKPVAAKRPKVDECRFDPVDESELYDVACSGAVDRDVYYEQCERGDAEDMVTYDNLEMGSSECNYPSGPLDPGPQNHEPADTYGDPEHLYDEY